MGGMAATDPVTGEWRCPEGHDWDVADRGYD